jgi:hypothetical protein
MNEIDDSVFDPDVALCREYDRCEQLPIGANDGREHIGLSPISRACSWDAHRECHFVVRTPSVWGRQLGEPTTQRIPDLHVAESTTFDEVMALVPLVEEVHSRRRSEGKPDDSNGHVCYACRVVALGKSARLASGSADPVAIRLMRLLDGVSTNDPAIREEALDVLATLPAHGLSETAVCLQRLLILHLGSGTG